MIMIAASGGFAWADPDLENLAEKLSDTKQKMLEEEKSQRKILSGLYEINKKIKSMSDRRSRLSEEVLVSDNKARTLAKSIALLESKISDERQGLSRRLRTLYMLNGQGALRILFGSQNGQEFDRNLKYLKILSERDYRVIRDFESNLRLLVEQKDKLKTRVERLVASQRRLKEQRDILSAQQTAKSKLLQDLREARRKYEARLKDLRRRAGDVEVSELDSDVEDLLKPSFFEQRGQLPSPVDGLVTESFGILEDDEFGLQLAHKGLSYSVPRGSDVRSIFDGQVLFVGKVPGYGKTMIIDHGDNYYSVLSHLKNNLASHKDVIKAGQVIGKSGFNSERNEDGVYFEIRHFSEAVDPKLWLRQDELKRSEI